MGIDVTHEHLGAGDLIRVTGKRTETTGTYRGIGLTEDGKPRILIEVTNMPVRFAYDFDEISMIERLAGGVAPGGILPGGDAEVDMVERSYDEDVMNANAGGHSGTAVPHKFG